MMAESLRASLIEQFGKQCGLCGRRFYRLTVEPIVASSPVSLTNSVLMCQPCVDRCDQ
jgi:hypothetical protein